MNNSVKYYIVEASALPEIFLKVAEAKRLLATGEAATVNEATRMTDISRSAFYKYRDAVQPFRDMSNSRIITFQFLLRDEPGVLSAILKTFSDYSMNLFTVSSITPSNGCAVVTTAAECTQAQISVDEMLYLLQQIPGVIKAEVMAAGG